MLGCYVSIYLIARIGRRPLFHFGTVVSFITNIVTGIGYLPHFYVNGTLSTGQIIPLMIMLYLYTFVYGATLGPITFSYTPEMTPARFVPIAIAANWIGSIITIVIFPIIS
jgi:MFS family permease